MTTRKQDEIGLWIAIAFIVWTIAVCLSALFSAPKTTLGGHHEAPRVTPAPVAGSAGSRADKSFVSDAERRMTPARSVRLIGGAA